MNMSNSQPIIDYLNEKNILWFPSKLWKKPIEKDGVHQKDEYGQLKYQKIPCSTADYKPDCNDFKNQTLEEIKRRQQFVDDYDYIFIDTSRVIQMDVDKPIDTVSSETQKFIDNCPYYLSITKQSPKIFIEPPSVNETSGRLQYKNDKDVELLCGQWSVCKKDVSVFNTDKDIPPIPMELLKHETRNEVTHDRLNFKQSTYSIDDIRKLIYILDKKYYNNHHLWFRVGAGIYNTLGDTEEAYELFDEWSSQSYKHGGVRELWRSFMFSPLTNITIGSLRYYAKTSDEKKYREFCKEYNAQNMYKKFYNNELFCDENHAKCLRWILNGKIVTCKEKRSTNYYIFENHRWIKKTHESDLVKMINKQLRQFLYDKYQDYNKKAEVCEDDDDLRERYVSCAKKVVDEWTKLGNAKKKTGIIKEFECLVMKEQEAFTDKLDEYRHLIGFNNGVYDLDKNEFRDAIPSDLITMSTNYDFVEQDEDIIKKELLDFISSIMNGKTMSDYLLKTLAYQLHGNKYLELIYYWTGVGSNGKSVVGDLAKYTFGGYYYKPDVKMITTQKQSASSQSEYLMKSKGRRFVFMTEPEESEKIQASLMKEWSGGDDIQSRGMYESSAEFKPQFAMQIAMNEKADLSGSDANGIARRLRIIPFVFKFCDEKDMNPDNPFDKLVDRTLKQKFEHDIRYRQQFMRILIEYYNEHVKGNKNIEDPPEVLVESSSYINDQDGVQYFIDAFIIKDKESNTDRRDIYRAFKDSSFYDGKSNKAFFKKLRSKGFSEMKSGCDKFIGIKLKEVEEVEEDEL